MTNPLFSRIVKLSKRTFAFPEGCGWCGKLVEDKTGISAGTLSFCSELCFSQSRRANFKKNKTCDWCRHVRHTVSYVDFQDGASQLQFCSDKCLNQYKMHIFCRETRAHLEMHPHLAEDNGGGLITPDLWLKNCRSPDRATPSPPASPREAPPQTSPLPLITVAHPSKLLAPSALEENGRRKRAPVQRRRKRPPTAAAFPNDLPQDLRIRQSPPAAPFEAPPQFADGRFRDVRVPPPRTFQSGPRPPNVEGMLPPVTILVPYPILVPVPLPVPIPLPMQSFLDAEKTRGKEHNGFSSHRKEGSANSDANGVEIEKIVENGVEPGLTADDGNVAGMDEDLSSGGIPRPPRKRKRVIEAGSKIVLKNSKKPLSA